MSNPTTVIILMKITLSKSLHISNFPFAADSWRGVNFQRSATFTQAPCYNQKKRNRIKNVYLEKNIK